jgi:NitT/TauT family transport system ATP-binding protein
MTEISSSNVAFSATDTTMVYSTTSDPVHALDRISFSATRGEFLSVLGPSGCGKSTLLMLLAGLRTPSSGTLTMNDKVVRGPQPDIGIVFQQDVLLDWRTCLQNILLPIQFRRLPKKDYIPAAMDLIHQVGLTGFEDRYPYELSGGMRQRVAICRALIQSPQTLLMDEPFGALDALTREQLMLDLQTLWMSQTTTVLFITHSIHEAVYLSDRVIVMTPRPGAIFREFPIDIARPRTLSDMNRPDFLERVEEIREVFTEMGVLNEQV